MSEQKGAGEMEPYELLESALHLIEDESNWCVGAVERGGARCAIGALNFAATGENQGGDGKAKAIGMTQTDRELYRDALRALDQIAERDGYVGQRIPDRGHQPAIAYFNNAEGHAATVALFQEAIRNEKAKAGIPVDLPEPAPTEVPA